MQNQFISQNSSLSKLIQRAQGVARSFETIEYYKVLRAFNNLVDIKANEGVTLYIGMLSLNGGGFPSTHTSHEI
jgi:hypothetical protein